MGNPVYLIQFPDLPVHPLFFSQENCRQRPAVFLSCRVNKNPFPLLSQLIQSLFQGIALSICHAQSFCPQEGSYLLFFIIKFLIKIPRIPRFLKKRKLSFDVYFISYLNRLFCIIIYKDSGCFFDKIRYRI